MKNKLHKLNIITAAIITAVLFISIMISVVIYMSSDFNQYDNTVRLLVKQQMDRLEDGVYNEGEYPYLVIDLSGKVLYADTEFKLLKGNQIDVQEILQYDKSFALKYKDSRKECFVLRKNGAVDRFAVFLVPKSTVYSNSKRSKGTYIFSPIAAGFTISIIILILRTVYISNRILKPLTQISTSAKGIIAGNYDLEMLRAYGKRINDNEVGDLTYSFELMRDELKAKQIKEEALKKSQKELISCISHDLKTPISTIKAYSEGLRDNIAKNREQQIEFINIIINKTNLLIDMISELLEYSNAQLNQLEINRVELYFLDYFDPLMKEVKLYVEQNGYEFIYLHNLPNLIVTIDPKRITEVIYNLVENSMKYMGGKKGKITIKAEYEEQNVLIKVIDNGPGISADDIPYVFDMFYRAEKSRSLSIPGSGLGLSICKYIINEHGGDIYCKGGVREGCEIGFTVPR